MLFTTQKLPESWTNNLQSTFGCSRPSHRPFHPTLTNAAVPSGSASHLTSTSTGISCSRKFQAVASSQSPVHRPADSPPVGIYLYTLLSCTISMKDGVCLRYPTCQHHCGRDRLAFRTQPDSPCADLCNQATSTMRHVHTISRVPNYRTQQPGPSGVES